MKGGGGKEVELDCEVQTSACTHETMKRVGLDFQNIYVTGSEKRAHLA